jgi:hypothetical protein
MTATADRIRDHHFPKWLELFQRKSREYGEATHEGLGPRGQFSDIYRKVVKLKKFMWDEPEAVPEFEDIEEIIDDLIGHLFLTKDMIWKGNQERVRMLASANPMDPDRQYIGPAEVEAREMLDRMWAHFDDDDEPDEGWIEEAMKILKEAHVKRIVGWR